MHAHPGVVPSEHDDRRAENAGIEEFLTAPGDRIRNHIGEAGDDRGAHTPSRMPRATHRPRPAAPIRCFFLIPRPIIPPTFTAGTGGFRAGSQRGTCHEAFTGAASGARAAVAARQATAAPPAVSLWPLPASAMAGGWWPSTACRGRRSFAGASFAGALRRARSAGRIVLAMRQGSPVRGSPRSDASRGPRKSHWLGFGPSGKAPRAMTPSQETSASPKFLGR